MEYTLNPAYALPRHGAFTIAEEEHFGQMVARGYPKKRIARDLGKAYNTIVRRIKLLEKAPPLNLDWVPPKPPVQPNSPTGKNPVGRPAALAQATTRGSTPTTPTQEAAHHYRQLKSLAKVAEQMKRPVSEIALMLPSEAAKEKQIAAQEAENAQYREAAAAELLSWTVGVHANTELSFLAMNFTMFTTEEIQEILDNAGVEYY